MDTARYIRITNLCMLFFRAEGIAFSLYDKRDTCHLQYPEEPQRNTAALFAGRDPARTLDICTTPSHAGYASIRIKGGWRIVIGPVYNARLNESLVDAFMAENQIPAAQRHAADTILEAAPNLSLLEFFDKAAYLYYCMDGEILDPSVYFDLTNDRDSFTVGRDTVEKLFSVTNIVRVAAIVLVVLLIFVAFVFINNTIRLAITARRREIAIMRLVGASNGFIRGPFIMEGTLESLIGAGLAIAALAAGMSYVMPRLENSLKFLSFYVSPQTLWLTYGGLLVLGVLIGLFSSAIAMRRYLKV